MALRSELFIVDDRGPVSEHGFYEEDEEMPRRSRIDELYQKIKDAQEVRDKDQADYADTKLCVKELVSWKAQLPPPLKDSMKVELSPDDLVYQRLDDLEGKKDYVLPGFFREINNKMENAVNQ